MAVDHLQPSDIGVVILNYNDYKSTINCLQSVLQCDPLPSRVVVVDNDSPNESFEMLRPWSGRMDIVEVVKSPRNGGYSAGLNIGIKRLRRLGCRAFVLATSDTEIQTGNIFAHISDSIVPGVGVLGPRIIEPDGNEQNPSLERQTVRYCLSLIWLAAGQPGRNLWFQMRRRGFFERKIPKKTGQESRPDAGHQPRVVYKLHGSFQVLSEQYLDEVGILDEDIFMFGEEDLIAWRCEEAGLKKLMLTNSCVRHENDSSIRYTHRDSADEFVISNEKRSAKLLYRKIDLVRLFLSCFRDR